MCVREPANRIVRRAHFRLRAVSRSEKEWLVYTRASLAADNVSVMDAQELFECACYERIVKPALVTQVHSQLTYALMLLVRLVFTLL